MSEHTRREFIRGAAGIAVGGSILAIAAACGASGSSTGSETTWQRIKRTKLIRVGMANQVPYAYPDSNGKLVGQGPAVLAAALASYGTFEQEGVLSEFASLIPGLLANRFDVICTGMFIRPKRCLQINFGNPDSLSTDAFVVKKGNPLNIHSYADVAKNSAVRLALINGGRGGR